MPDPPSILELDLPGPLADPLHLLPAWPRQALLAAFLALAALLALAAWRRWRRRRPRSAPPPVPIAPLPAARIDDELARIRRDFDDEARHRAGCHELAAALRRHYRKPAGTDLEALTVTELARAVPVAVVVELFDHLARLQFRRRPPSGSEFRDACDRAVLTVHAGSPP